MSIYLDNAATTAPAPAVIEAMQAILSGDYGNCASTHAPGAAAAAVVESARADVAALVGADEDEIVWLSGATEADNLAIRGVADFHRREGGRIVTVRTEHKAVVDTVRQLESRGLPVTWLDVDAGGRLDPEAVRAALTDDVILLSVMHVNNETGVVQDIAALGELARERGITFHVDAAQSLGKLAVDVDAMHIDLLSLSAHKLHGPQGVGALYVRRRPRARLLPQIFGGGQERGLRSGTLATHQIAGMAAACRLAGRDRPAEQQRVAQLRAQLWQRLLSLEGIERNGNPQHCVGGILNISVRGVDGEALLAGVTGGDNALAVSAGSACTSAAAESSYVLRAMGRSPALAGASLRLSLGRYNDAGDVAIAADKIVHEVERLRAMSPLWQAAEQMPLQPVAL